MKKLAGNPFTRLRIIRIALSLTLLFTLTAVGLHYYEEWREEEEREAEEHEGVPEVLKQMELWTEMRAYPNSELDATEFNSAYKMAQAMAKTAKDNIALNGVASSTWNVLAPMNFSGRILSVAIHPTNANIMWVGSASGGLWKTTNGGTGAANGINWQYIPTGFPVLGVSSIAINPSNGNEIYVGTGEVYSTNPGGSSGAGHIRVFRGSYGIGILKSTDGGTTWTKSLDFSQSSLKGVMDLVINPTTPSTIFAATTDGVYRSTNSGSTWTLVLNYPFAMDMVFKPGDPNTLYIGCGNFASTGTGIYKSTNANAATPTFTKLTSPNLPNPISGKIQLAISANNANKIYASIGRDPNTSDVQGLYISTDQGATWSAAAASGVTTILGNQGWYAHDVAVSSADANRVIWGELDTYTSTNGGSSFTKTGNWSSWDINNTTIGDLTEGASNTTGYVHADVHRIVNSPNDATGNTFFLCTDGGLFRSTNGGSAFNTLNGGLNTAQIYANMAQHPTNSNYMLLGLQDNEAMVYEGNQGCRRIGNLGDGFHAAMNSNGTIQLVESYYFNRRRSTNSGGTFGAGTGAVGATEYACFNVPMVFSKTSGSAYMFAGTNVFKRSTNSGNSFTDLNGGTPIAGSQNPAISMVAPNDNLVYFSTAPANGVRSKLWKTANATVASPTFTEITGTLPDRYYSDIETDPNDPNRVIVTLSGFGSSHVYLSLNGGSSWSDIGGNLPDVPHNTIYINSSNPRQVYVGNDLGVYVANWVPTTGTLSATTSVNWVSYNTGLGDAIMANDLQMAPNGKLRLGTYGRGLWEVDPAAMALPVVMKEFRGWGVETGNQLSWIVTSQMNVDHFEVEYSSNGTDFRKIASVNPRNQSGDIRYDYLHKFDRLTDAFYRIRVVDADGAYQYSNVELVKAITMVTKAAVYPNPVTGSEATLKIVLKENTMVDIEIFNSAGALVYVDRRQGAKGENQYRMNIARLAAGVYQVRCRAAESQWATTMVKR